jgi:hypothetical protein
LDVAYWISCGNCYAWSSGVIVAIEKLGFFCKISKNYQKNQNYGNSLLHFKSEYCLMDIVMLFPQSFIRVWFFWESRLQHKCTNKILINCVFGNSKFIIPSTLTIDLGFASVNNQCLRDNKLAIPSYPVNKYIIYISLLKLKILWFCFVYGGGSTSHISVK